ncbi:MAG: transposase [Myxococcota bacterium]|nr:transposase [Myxococcota bacterium]
MRRYIGIDVHAASCTLVVVSETGRRLRSAVVETNGEALVGTVLSVAGERHVILEEGTQAGWISELLEPHVHEVVVTQASGGPGQKNDEADAFALANQLRLGAVERRVFKAEGQFRELRQLARVYRMVLGDTVRTKNRVKSLYRARGIPTDGRAIFNPSHRSDWLGRLDAASRLAAQPLFDQLDAVSEIRERAGRAMVAESHRHPVSRQLETAPGLGPLRVAQILPIVAVPDRFRTRRQFWSYCGLGIVMRSSSDWVQAPSGWDRARVSETRGLNKHANMTLKHIFKGAATTVIQSLHDDPLYDHYAQLLANGTKPDLARLTIARRIAAITLRLWKSQEAYDPNRIARDRQLTA